MTTRRESTKLYVADAIASVERTMAAVARIAGVSDEEMNTIDAEEFRRRRDARIANDNGDPTLERRP